MQNRKGMVYLVGAGCGKADLITVRGKRLLEQCDAVVYDDLIDPTLLHYAGKAKLFPVGKRSGKHSMSQQRINQLLIELADAGHRVVRLKGGDPFVFGRGGEEYQALEEAEIRCEEVPGISSCIAIPAEAGIPVTHRQVSRSFHVITGHTADTEDTLPESLETLARLNGTLIFLMGLRSISSIAKQLIAAGKSEDTPVAVLSGGNASHPSTLRGTLKNIGQKVKKTAFQPPAVIVVGEVAAYQMRTTIRSNQPLSEVRVGLVGTSAYTNRLATRLEAMGAIPIPVLIGEIQPLPLKASWKEVMDGREAWVVFTSQNGVDTFFEALVSAHEDIRHFQSCHFATIGKATSEALSKHGIQADLVPEYPTVDRLTRMLCERVRPNEEIFLFRAAGADAEMRDQLQTKGFSVREYLLYDTEYQKGSTNEELDYLTFGSAGGVRAWFKSFGTVSEGVRAVCIGPVTAQAFASCSDRPFLLAKEISADGVIACLLEDYPKKQPADESTPSQTLCV